ncbi:50S ribosomal protein L11 methyltransferase [Suttonella ornithocola]|uniref:Ribosomal protein L11 methyltransferase n=1 Tax=Suttonella ornithocola TaxID=279832 RepID=A0A380MVI2_9GAMM|nr:50S ribosomal protein L11 methyltransferase [Suttonella ornithocola]SUO96056.1 Ribosomal protein L11 methyltransferase [Suttonella ornithocola]
MTEKQWLELTLTAHNDDEALLLETALELSGALAVTYQAADEQEIFEPPIGTTPLWQTTKVTGLYDLQVDKSEVLSILKQSLGDNYPIGEHLLKDEDWVRAWLDYFQPIPFGKNFWVAATEHRIDEPNATVLRLDPGLAFGTGTHPSTAMCLSALVNHITLQDKTVYDYGSGSGILGIAAALLGAEHVWQTDIDPQALQAGAENAEKNGVRDKITLCENPNDAPKVDILMANILLEPLCVLRTQFEKHLHEKSVLYFAGLLERQESVIREHYEEAYNIHRIDDKEGWILLELHPKH